MTTTRSELTQLVPSTFPTTTPRLPRPKPFASAAREKKQSLHKNPTKVRKKGKLDKTKHLIEPIDLDDKELTMGID